MAVLRIVTGLILLAHGIPKLLNVAGFVSHIAGIFPEPLNWIVGIITLIVEVVGGILLVINYRAYLSGLATAILFFGIAAIMQGAHFVEIFNSVSSDGQSKFEYPFLIGVAGLAIFLSGRRSS